MWRMVDQIRIGQRGYALVVAPDGTLIAHGDPDKKALVAQSRNMKGSHPLVDAGSDGPTTAEYLDQTAGATLAVAAPIPQLRWTVIVEQPTSEAYASATALQRYLTVAIVMALLVMIGIGLVFGRRFIAPIFILKRGTQAVASGDLESRVDIKSADEFASSAPRSTPWPTASSSCRKTSSGRNARRCSDRVAAGIVHDLSHPIQNIGNSTRLLLRDDIDAESRISFHQTIERELVTLKRFMEDLRNVVKPKPVERFAMDVNTTVAEIVESMRAEGERNGVKVEAQYAQGSLMIDGDRFALGRVFRNLITNGIQATAPAGESRSSPRGRTITWRSA